MDDIVKQPMVIPTEAYISEAYARAENEKLWPKVWQIACRTEEVPNVGDYVTYNILDESIIVVRTTPDKIAAYYNVCQHRGRRLTEGCGHTKQFFCRFHGWRWDIHGENIHVLDGEDWNQALTPEKIRLKQVKLDTWGGWVWINMDPKCEPLKKFLEPAVSMLGPFELEKMRFRWRQWLYFPCNWKTALEAFSESYHGDISHAQLRKWFSNKSWCKTENNCTWHGVGESRGGPQARGGAGLGSVMAAPGQDPRVAAAELHEELMRTLNATTTQTLVNAAKRLVDELPPGTPAEQVGAHLMSMAERDDAARGVIWPKIDPALQAAVGHDWHVFPNSILLVGITFALCYRARPNGFDPNSCIFEVYVIERFPEGQEPKTEWVFEADPSEEKWKLILAQDFVNMPEVQKGMKSRGFEGSRPNPLQEIPILYFHQLLAKYMGTGKPKPLA
jgi:nitrite reductase/ring-hydroxylating ferredoxin subunit